MATAQSQHRNERRLSQTTSRPHLASVWRDVTTLLAGCVVVGMMLFGASACHRRTPPPSTPAMRVEVISGLSPAEAPLVRQARMGLKRLKADLNVAGQFHTVTTEHEGRLALRAAGRSRQQLVYCLGHDFAGPLYEEAVAYPATWYVVIPGTITGPNIASIDFATGEPGYLAGVAAGTARRGRHAVAGIIREGGKDPFFARAEGGFTKGFEAAVRHGRVLVADGPTGIPGMQKEGVRVALDTSEVTDPAVVAACREAGITLVTADPSLVRSAPDLVLGTLRLDLAEAMNRVAQEVWAGTMEGKLYRFDLGSGVVSFVLNPASDAAAQPAVRDAVEKARADVTAGIVEIEELGW